VTNERTVGVGVIGTGFARTTQIPCLQATPGMEVVGLLSRNMTRAYDLAQEFGLRRAFDDLDRMLKVDEIELVLVSSPPHLHLPQTLAALRAGKHVLCEKPTALHAGEALEMWRAGEAAGRLHLIDHELRFHPRRIRMKQLVDEGFLGTPTLVELHIHGPFRLDPARTWSWWSDVAQGGGSLGALGSHAVDAVRWLLGEFVEVRGRLVTVVKERPDPETGEPHAVTSDDDATVWGRLESGAEVTMRLATALRDDPSSAILLQGTRGSLKLDEKGPLLSRPQGADAWTEVPCDDLPLPPEGTKVPDTPWARAFLLYAAAIRDALRAGRTTLPGASTFEDGWRNQRVLDAARESAKRGDWVAVDAMGPRA
jgi:predicted dehydrogenase